MMNRPEVFNAFNELMISELAQGIAHCVADPAVRLIVLAGAGRAFSAGADIQWMRRASEAAQDWNLADARRFADMLHGIASCPKPTIARVQGLALGGGVGLAVACDIALASSDAKFAVSEARFGILPSVIGPYVGNAVGGGGGGDGAARRGAGALDHRTAGLRAGRAGRDQDAVRTARGRPGHARGARADGADDRARAHDTPGQGRLRGLPGQTTGRLDSDRGWTMSETKTWRDAAAEPALIGVVGAGIMGAGIAQVAAQAGHEVRLL